MTSENTPSGPATILVVPPPDGNPRLPTLLIGSAVFIPVVLAVCLIWASYSIYSSHLAAEACTATLTKAAARILHLDEVLTMSARMAAATGDKAWIVRYQQFEPELDRIIQEATSLAPTGDEFKMASATDEANIALVKMEKRSFELVLAGRKEEAWTLLTGSEYDRQKKIYADGMTALVQRMETRQQDESETQNLHLKAYLIGQGLAVALLIVMWYLVLRSAVAAWRRKAGKLKILTEELQLSEESLRRDEGRQRALLELSQKSELSGAEISKYAMESSLELTGSTIGYIAFLNEDESVLTMHYWSNAAMAQCAMMNKPVVYPVKDTGLWGEAVRRRAPVITNDYAAPNPAKRGTPEGHVKLTRHMNIPVFDGSKIVAVAGVGNKKTDYTQADVTQLTLMMEGMWRIVRRKQVEEGQREAHRRRQQINQLLQSLLGPAPLEDKLKSITDNVVRIFGADFCRIWIIRPGELCEQGCMHAGVHDELHTCRHRDQCLHLLASSGRYTHLDGKAHRRVPFGCYKIGRIASGKEHKFLTNDVVNAPGVHNHEWARELGLVSFAGYQLRVPGGQTLGVLALFAQRPLSVEEDAQLDGLSSAVAFVVQQAAAEEVIRRAQAEAEKANVAKSLFLANMSHEIRTPMTAILGFTELMGNSIECCTTCPEHQTCPIRVQNKEYIQVIQRNGQHLLGLINDILDLSKIDAGKLEVERVPCSPVQLVEETVSLMRVYAIEKGLTLDAQYEFPLPESVLSDPNRVRQILVNLVGNAIKFTNQGQVKIVVRYSAESQAGRAALAFEVKDTGIGMTAEQVDRLFQPFVQADSSTTRQYGGTGLGLAISKKLAETLEGKIKVASQLGTGSTITFAMETQLPTPAHLLNDLSEMAARATPRPPSASPVSARIRGRVLLAEDAPVNQRLLSIILNKAGAEVDLADNGRVAVEKALAALSAEQPYDAILMDMQMPEMDGYTATRKLRQSGYTGPIVALTAHAMVGDREKCLAAGCDDYATKPVDRFALLWKLARLTGSPETGSPNDQATGAVSPLSDEVIPSAFRDDQDMAGIIAEFVSQLPQRLEEMRLAGATNQWAMLQRMAHQLKGAGGGYGYDCLTDGARELETQAKKEDAEGAVLALNHLRQLCQRIQAGHRLRAVAPKVGET